MQTYTTSEARGNLYKLVDQIAEAHEPICIAGKRHNVVMISEEDFRAIEETLYLLSVPGMRESIMAARQEPVESSADRVDW